MSTGLQVSRLIGVDINLAPQAAQFANLRSLVIVGDSDVIDTGERIRSYNDLASVATDFGTSAPEYKAALLFFAQNPQPTQLYIAKWAFGATKGRLKCGILSASQQLMSNFTAVSSGGFSATIDGTLRHFATIDLSAETNLNGVANKIDTAITSYATCVWTGTRFVIKSKTTGAASAVTALTAPSSGTDIKALLNGTVALGAIEVVGIVAESAVDCVAALDALSTTWYGLTIASTNVVDDDHVDVAAFIEASASKHIYGVSTQDTGTLDAEDDSDIASVLKAAQYTRTFVQYSDIPYVAASMFGRALTVDFTANNSMITLMYKQEPGVTPETLTAAEADALISKRCNFFVNYNNGTAILQNAVMSGPYFFDEIHGTDWLADAIQTNVYNLLYTSLTKIPQTDAGNHLIATTIEATCAAGVNNGLLAPGTWNSGGFGTLEQGQNLPKGYYVYAPPVASQAQADREARKSVAFQVAAKLAGAIHSVDILVNVNR